MKWARPPATPHSPVQQADAQVTAAAEALAEDEAPGGAVAPLHSDQGLGFRLHVELHDGPDQGPVAKAPVDRLPCDCLHLLCRLPQAP